MSTKKKVENRVELSDQGYKSFDLLIEQSKVVKRFFRYVFFEVVSMAGMLASFATFAVTDSFVAMVFFAGFFLFNAFCTLAKFWQVVKLAWCK